MRLTRSDDARGRPFMVHLARCARWPRGLDLGMMDSGNRGPDYCFSTFKESGNMDEVVGAHQRRGNRGGGSGWGGQAGRSDGGDGWQGQHSQAQSWGSQFGAPWTPPGASPAPDAQQQGQPQQGQPQQGQPQHGQPQQGQPQQGQQAQGKAPPPRAAGPWDSWN